ncbi:MAG: ketoacyl-ACP synthase III [Myxococcales bacterium]|nr:ketoacyl-ACP synthase III [Myxococcales bacterium]
MTTSTRHVTNACISGTGFYVPPRVVTNDDLIKTYGIETSDAWIQQRTGIEARRYAEAGIGSAELGEHAARAALAQAGLEPVDLDLIVFATLSPEFAFPGSGVILQDRLGLNSGANAKHVPALDVRNQCSGFLYSLATANAMVRSGACKHVLVVGAETHSAALDLSTRGRTVSSLFGDGAGAVIVSATDDDKGIRGVHLGADGSQAETLCQRVWDIRERPFIPLDDEGYGRVSPEFMYAHMDGRMVFKHAVAKMSGALKTACEAADATLDDVDLFFFHQANLRINQYVAELLKLPADKVPHNIERYGNTTAATLPILLAETVAEGRLKPGMKIAMVAFGSGFTWGSALIDW